MLDKEIQNYKGLSITTNYAKAYVIKARAISYQKGFKAANPTRVQDLLVCFCFKCIGGRKRRFLGKFSTWVIGWREHFGRDSYIQFTTAGIHICVYIEGMHTYLASTSSSNCTRIHQAGPRSEFQTTSSLHVESQHHTYKNRQGNSRQVCSQFVSYEHKHINISTNKVSKEKESKIRRTRNAKTEKLLFAIYT